MMHGVMLQRIHGTHPTGMKLVNHMSSLYHVFNTD